MLEAEELAIIEKALAIIGSKPTSNSTAFTSSKLAQDFFRLKLHMYEREVLAALYLNTRYAMIGYEEVFFGTIDHATIHVREIIKSALRMNAAAVIVAHNHPSGDPSPSTLDIQLTRRIKEALDLVDIRLVDHVIVGAQRSVSLADSMFV